jgi:hypothetical protein
MKTGAKHQALTRNAGKANAMLEAWANAPKGFKTGIVYVTTRREVESLDTSRFLATFRPEAGAKELWRLRSNVHFAVEGYEGTDAEIFEIPEVREFYGRLHQLHPCWVYMARLDCPCLHAVALSVAPNITVCRSSQSLRVHAHPGDFGEFVLASVETLFGLDRAVGIPVEASVRSLSAAARYFGIY